MKTLWAPWRMEFILKAHGRRQATSRTCVFCLAQKDKPSPKNLVLYRDELAYVIMNKYPYANGHVLIIPNRHVGALERLSVQEHGAMGMLLAKSLDVLKKALKAEGFNIGMNLGQVAGAGIREHLHYHIVPRWNGDHNFMPVMGDVRVMPEFMEETYAKLKRAFDLP